MKFSSRILLALLLAGCSHQGIRSPSGAKWANKLTCDDGLRIDADQTMGWQLVLFGDAARHFAEFGAYDLSRLNEAGEFVSGMQPDHYEFHAILHDGMLVMNDNFDRGNPSFEVRRVPYSNGGGKATNYLFHRCH